jgi:predicted nucleic acid-binding protein
VNGNEILLDTNAVLYLLNGDETLAVFLTGQEICISIITEIELLSFRKITEVERKKLVHFISLIQVLPLNDQVKNHAIEIRKTSQLKIPDSIIAGTSMAFQIPVLSSDKQLKTVKEIQLVFYDR